MLCSRAWVFIDRNVSQPTQRTLIVYQQILDVKYLDQIIGTYDGNVVTLQTCSGELLLLLPRLAIPLGLSCIPFISFDFFIPSLICLEHVNNISILHLGFIHILIANIKSSPPMVHHHNHLAWKTSTTSPSSISSWAGVM